MSGDTLPDDQLMAIASSQEIGIASRRLDGSLRPAVTIWVVVVDGDVYVRSAYGAENGWYRRLVASGSGRVSGNGRSADVVTARPDDDVLEVVDLAYKQKYVRYPGIVRGMVGHKHWPVTLRLDPVRP